MKDMFYEVKITPRTKYVRSVTGFCVVRGKRLTHKKIKQKVLEAMEPAIKEAKVQVDEDSIKVKRLSPSFVLKLSNE